MELEKLYVLDHAPINVYFSKNSDDFVVRELPLYEFSGSGEHLIIHIQKKDTTTIEAIKEIAKFLNIDKREIGYAGLKDKDGFTMQYLSLPKIYEKELAKFSHEKIKINETFLHKNKLKVGHLSGNSFFIQLKKVSKVDAKKLQEVLDKIDKMGYANYFGYQRFGKFDNIQKARLMLKGEFKPKNRQLEKLLISSLQSFYFNKWLSSRVKLSKFADEFSVDELAKIYQLSKDEAKEIKNQPNFYRLLKGEVLGHYPRGMSFLCENLEAECVRFGQRDISSLGPIYGKKMQESSGFAKTLEESCFDESCSEIGSDGTRRVAWSFLKELKYSYNEDRAWFMMSFILQKGSYATTVLSEILHSEIF